MPGQKPLLVICMKYEFVETPLLAEDRKRCLVTTNGTADPLKDNTQESENARLRNIKTERKIMIRLRKIIHIALIRKI
jgi:hypothetical protein